MGKAKSTRKKKVQEVDNDPLQNLVDLLEKSVAELGQVEEPTVQISEKRYELNTDNIKSLGDVKEILKAMQMIIYWPGEEVPEKFKTIYERGLLKEIKDEETI